MLLCTITGMTTPMYEVRRALAGACCFLAAARTAQGNGSTGVTITRFDDSSIDTAALTQPIE
ncbi:MAG: hypothetical protein ACT4P6_19365 [Gemmatimonadaceae bacterium]